MDETEVTALIAEHIERWIARLGRQFGPLSRPQRRALLLLEGGEMRVGDLAERMGNTVAGATRMVDTLEEEGLVQRFRQPHTDQRQVYLLVTAAGHAALAAANQVFRDRVSSTLTALTPEEKEALSGLLLKISQI